jgi:hypothetical protein
VVQETDKIKDHIDAERGNLERDLHEIEHRVRRAVDWRGWFDRKPVTVLGAAAAGGFVLSLLMRRTPSSPQTGLYESDSGTSPTQARQSKLPSKTSFHMDRMAQTFDNTVAAMLGVASHKIRDFIADLIPNFREEYREVEAKRTGTGGGTVSY